MVVNLSDFKSQKATINCCVDYNMFHPMSHSNIFVGCWEQRIFFICENLPKNELKKDLMIL